METTKKSKVVFVHPDLGIGGAERLILDMAVALAKEGNKVSFVTNHFDKTHAFDELKSGNFTVHVVGDWIPRSICGICQALCAYIRMIYLSVVYVLFIRKQDKPDVYFVDQIPMAVPFIKLVGGKVIYYCHHPDLLASPPGGMLKKLYRMPINWLELKCTALADVVLVNSAYTASIFRKTFLQISEDIQILYPTISEMYKCKIDNYIGNKSINTLIPDIPVVADQVIFLSINRYHPAKKLELALNGLEALKTKLSSHDWQRVHLIIAGGYDPQSAINANYFSQLIEISQNKQLSSKVTFLKSLSDDLKTDLLVACDCLIYTPENEHFGIVPLEAMTANKPVIACNSGGPCETIEDNVTGYLCDPTPDSLADMMVKVLDKDKAKKMGSLGKKRLEKFFSHTAFAKAVNNIVNLVASNDSMSATPAEGELQQSFVKDSPKKEKQEVSPPKVEVYNAVADCPEDEMFESDEIEQESTVQQASTLPKDEVESLTSSSSTENLYDCNSTETLNQSVEVANEAFSP